MNQLSGPSGAPVTDLLPGDGTAGGDFTFAFTSLRADFDQQDDDVDITDFGLFNDFLTAYQQNGGTASLASGDLDGDVDIVDFGLFADDFGMVWESLGNLLASVDYDGDGDVDQNDRVGVDAFDQLFANQDASADLNSDGLWDATTKRSSTFTLTSW